MTFAAPLFLLAAMAAAIPVVLHMVNRRRAKEAPFPTLRFLKLSVEKTRRRKRLQDLLLLVLRAAVLALLAVALARPALTGVGSLWGEGRTAAAIVLDNSASMGAIDRDRVRLDTAAAAAGRILDQLGEGDQVALLPACGPTAAEPAKLDSTQHAVREILQQCRVGYQKANLVLKLRQAQALLAEADAPNKQIYVLTDMQRVSWLGDGRQAAAGTTTFAPGADVSSAAEHKPLVVLVDCNRVPKPNAAVERIELDSSVRLAGLPMKVVVTVANVSAVEQQRLVELVLDGEKRASSPQLTLPPGGRAKHDFTASFQGPGPHRGEARLVGEDGSAYDDRRFFVVNVAGNIPVAVVVARRHEIPYLDDAFYLHRALASAGGFDVASLTAGELVGEPLGKYKALFCVNLPALDVETAGRLADYVSDGGNLVWLCGGNVDPEAYNRMNLSAAGRLLPSPLTSLRRIVAGEGRDSWRVGFLDAKYPPLKNLVDPASLYESILVYRRVGMSVEKGLARVLARLDDGEPLLVERGVGEGRTLMLGIAATVDWSNLPLRPIFMPLVVQLAFHLAESGRPGGDLIAGQPLQYRLDDSGEPREVELVPPDGAMLRLTATGRFNYANTFDVGIYELRIPGAAVPSEAAFAVNFDPAEADPMKIEPAELESLLDGAPMLAAADPDDLSAAFVRLREGKGLWGPLLSVVLIALVFETLISNRFGAKRRSGLQ
ncbi:MAG: BatA domain-containing protein [Pirellulales bacterium]|nr:BatA domain-containing protein [Pirellulales bacterium]